MNDMQKGVITLIKSAVTQEKLPLPDGFSIDEAYDFIMKHKIFMLAYDGAVRCGISKENPAMKMLFQNYIRGMMKSERQMKKIKEISEVFEEAKIDYLPLKGCNMKKLYPKPELRYMGDADILIREEQYPKIKEILEKLGYEGEEEAGHHYEWRNGDFLAEIHIMPFSKGFEKLYDYYGNGWKKARKTDTFRYEYSAEDEFIFEIVHLAKHYLYSGVGCRHAADIFVYLRAFPDMDFAYIEGEFEKMGMKKFYRNLMNMIDCWFGKGEPDEASELISEYILKSGNWGDFETASLAKGLRESEKENGSPSKAKSFIRTVFPSAKELQNKYKILKKAPVLLPFIWVIRWLEVLFLRRDKLSGKIKYYDYIDDEKIKAHRRNLEKAGFEL